MRRHDEPGATAGAAAVQEVQAAADGRRGFYSSRSGSPRDAHGGEALKRAGGGEEVEEHTAPKAEDGDAGHLAAAAATSASFGAGRRKETREPARGTPSSSPESRGAASETGLDALREEGKGGIGRHGGADETATPLLLDGAETSGGGDDNASSDVVAQAMRTPSTGRRKNDRSLGLLSSLRGTVSGKKKSHQPRNRRGFRSASPQGRR